MVDSPNNPDIDRMSEKQTREMLKQLEKNRTILTLNLLGKDYERLTIVIGFKKVNKTSCFIIDYPQGFKEKAAENGGDRIKFEFIGPEKIQYVFRSIVAGISADGILVRFPDYIERIQRRRFFRIAPPLNTKLIFFWNMQRSILDVINLSVGGALLNQAKKGEQNRELAIGDALSTMHLVCSEKGFKLNLVIDKAVVKRVEQGDEASRRYAVQFLNLDQKKSNTLNAFIYAYQQEVLRRRYLLDRG